MQDRRHQDVHVNEIPPNWPWIEAETRPPGEWQSLAEMATSTDIEELGPVVLAARLREALSDAALRCLLEQP